jgi:hypothetical protein
LSQAEGGGKGNYGVFGHLEPKFVSSNSILVHIRCLQPKCLRTGQAHLAEEFAVFFFFSSLLLASSDTTTYEPSMRALLGTAPHFC